MTPVKKAITPNKQNSFNLFTFYFLRLSMCGLTTLSPLPPISLNIPSIKEVVAQQKFG